jgi:hypothetical protein
MASPIYDLSAIEAELQSLRSRLVRAGDDVERLHAIRNSFSELEAVYHDYQTHAAGWPDREMQADSVVSRTNEALTALQTHRNQIDQAVEDRWNGLKEALTHALFDHRDALHVLETGIEQRWQVVDAQFRSAVSDLDRRFGIHQESIDVRFQELKHTFDTRWLETRTSLTKVQDELYSSQRNLRAEVSAQLNEFRGELEHRIDLLRREWNQHQQQTEERLMAIHESLKGMVAALDNKIINLQSETTGEIAEVQRVASDQERDLALLRKSSDSLRLWTVSAGAAAGAGLLVGLATLLIALT